MSPSGAHAQSHIIRPCDLSAATGTKPESVAPQFVSELDPGTALELVLDRTFGALEEAPGAVAGDGEDEGIVWAECDARHSEIVASQGRADGLPCLRLVHSDDGVFRAGCFARSGNVLFVVRNLERD